MQNKSFGYNIYRGIQLRWNKIFHNPYGKLNVSPLKKIYFKHLNSGKARTHLLFGKELTYLSPPELLHGFQEIFIDEIYKQNLPANPYIIDCGANIGLSVIYLKLHHPDAEILAFEPDEKNFELLQKNVQSFNLGNVHLKKEAIWIEKTVLQFAGEGSMSSRIGGESDQHTIEVNAVRLKDYLNRQVDFLKIDIEGAEYQVMKDIAGELRYVNNLFLEYHGSFQQNSELLKLFSIIVENGFSYYIKEATSVYAHPFLRVKTNNMIYDVQLNIFCFRKK
jgi:FkbM family methyltransferase